MSKALTLGSLLDGIGGFPLAGMKAGIQPIWASEIEPFPIRVTTKRFPDMEHLGNIQTLHGGEIEPVSIVTFGSPCQNLSIAGKRTGLAGEQSSLFFEAVRIISEMREATHGQYPRWAVWENVPNALSTSGGFDYREVLESLVRVKDPEAAVPMPEKGKWLHAGEILGDGYSLAWRILDAAKGWGVAQRRRRIFVVVDLDGECAGPVLFESEGLSGYSPPRQPAREGTTAGAAAGAGATGSVNAVGFEPGLLRRKGDHHWEEMTGTLRAQMGDNQAAAAIEFNPSDSRIKLKEDGICQTLCSRMGTGGNQVPLAMQQKAYGISSDKSNGMLSDNPHAGIYEADTSRTLDCSGGHPGCQQGGVAIVAFAQNQRDEVRDLDNRAGALTASPGVKQQTYLMQGAADHHGDHDGDVPLAPDPADRPAPAYSMTTGSFTQVGKDITPPVMARDYKDPPLVGGADFLIRRLTPGECCRLQGYPDGWCEGLETEEPTDAEIAQWQGIFETHRHALGKKTKPRSLNQIRKWLQSPRTDAAEYKAYGNSIAVPCVHFIMAGIVWACGQCDEKLS